LITAGVACIGSRTSGRRRTPRDNLIEIEGRELRRDPDRGTGRDAGLSGDVREATSRDFTRLPALAPPEARHALKYGKSVGFRKACK
jgi:hypothetical protein